MTVLLESHNRQDQQQQKKQLALVKHVIYTDVVEPVQDGSITHLSFNTTYTHLALSTSRVCHLYLSVFLSIFVYSSSNTLII